MKITDRYAKAARNFNRAARAGNLRRAWYWDRCAMKASARLCKMFKREIEAAFKRNPFKPYKPGMSTSAYRMFRTTIKLPTTDGRV